MPRTRTVSSPTRSKPRSRSKSSNLNQEAWKCSFRCSCLFLFASWFAGFQIQSSVNFDSMSAQPDTQRMEKIVSLCKRRGFIFQSSEIYGGLNGLWDYGPLGVELKRNLKNYWWRIMVHERDDVVGMDGSILMNRAVWKASGHEDTFSDPMVDCRSCKARLRADQVIDKGKGKQCPVCGGKDLTEPRAFNLMFKTYVGATEDESSVTYLRPETAQAIFVQFKNILE